MANFIPVDLAYAAGIIDGEGTIGITEVNPSGRRRSPEFRVYVAVSMVDLVVPLWMRDTFEIGTLHSYPPKNPKHKVQHRWTVAGPRAVDFCDLIAPHLRVKRQQAETVVDFYRSREWKQRRTLGDAELTDRREYVTRIRALNARVENGGQ